MTATWMIADQIVARSDNWICSQHLVSPANRLYAVSAHAPSWASIAATQTEPSGISTSHAPGQQLASSCKHTWLLHASTDGFFMQAHLASSCKHWWLLHASTPSLGQLLKHLQAPPAPSFCTLQPLQPPAPAPCYTSCATNTIINMYCICIQYVTASHMTHMDDHNWIITHWMITHGWSQQWLSFNAMSSLAVSSSSPLFKAATRAAW